MTHIFRTITFVICLSVLYAWTTAVVQSPSFDGFGASADRLGLTPALHSDPPVSAPIHTRFPKLTAQQQELVDEARQLLLSEGFLLPAVTIEFPADPELCFDNGGVYMRSSRTVRICRPSLKTMVHELAHSWVETTLTATEREAFLDLRALETWAGGDRWDERGAEHAAEVITWAVMETDISVRWIETNLDGTTSYTTRLLKVPNTNRDELAAAYFQLTGEDPQKRLSELPVSLERKDEITSIEARRNRPTPATIDEDAQGGCRMLLTLQLQPAVSRLAQCCNHESNRTDDERAKEEETTTG